MRGGRGKDWVLIVSVMNLFLTVFLWLLIFLDWRTHSGYERVHRNLLWEVNRHGLILTREGLARPEDQLGLPEPIPNPGEPKP